MESPSWSVRRPVGELRPGDHAWLAYSGAAERRDVLDAFVGACGSGKDKVIVLCGPDGAEVPGDGRIAMVPLSPPDPGRLAETLTVEMSKAQASGYRGLRVVADLTWTLRRPDGLRLALDCERGIEQAVAPSTSAIAICQFDRCSGEPGELAALADAHAVAVTADPVFADPVLRIDRRFEPVGLALGGELDNSRHAVFGRALSDAMIRAGHGPVHLDLGDLEFIDLGALNMLAELAARRPLILDRMPSRLRTIVDTIGWDLLPGLRPGR